MRIIPESSAPSKVSSTTFGAGAPSIPALRDNLRNNGPVSMASQLNNKHPLQSRLEKWEETQFSLKMENYRRTMGPGEPIRRAMELEIVKQSDQLNNFSLNTISNLGASYSKPADSVHYDILMNKDTNIDWEDIYTDSASNDLSVLKMDFHAELAKKMNI